MIQAEAAAAAAAAAAVATRPSDVLFDIVQHSHVFGLSFFAFERERVIVIIIAVSHRFAHAAYVGFDVLLSVFSVVFVLYTSPHTMKWNEKKYQSISLFVPYLFFAKTEFKAAELWRVCPSLAERERAKVLLVGKIGDGVLFGEFSVFSLFRESEE